MFVDHGRRTVFIHNPKTGGRSIIKSFAYKDVDNTRMIHMSVKEARSCFFHDTWDGYFSFAFVRNPWDRMVSLYAYHRSMDYAFFAGANESHQLARNYAFEDWLQLNARRLKRSMWVSHPQSDWTDGVSKVFRFESWGESFDTLCENLQVQLPPHHENRSDHEDFKAYYTCQKSIDFVAQVDARTIAEHGYAI